jgi:hypothetical protein
VKSLLSILILLCVPSASANAQSSVEGLPDPLIFLDGRSVSDVTQWSARRTEMRALLLQYEYGHAPSPPGNVAMDSILESGTRFGDTSEFRAVRLRFGPDKQLETLVHLYLPGKASKPLPVILRFGLGGEHAQAANARGYAFVCFEQTRLDPDTEGHDVVGPAQAAYPQYDWGSIAVWAWCASRVLDYVETHEAIDAAKAVITGHSRTGKAALLAGALDERFALVVPNGSGCGGAAAYRNPPKGVETLELITRASRFKSWFHADFGQFADAEERLPFDQHFLRALVAPRPLLSTDAYGDQWCNPHGTQTVWQGGQPVYDFLGAGANNMIHFREGNHDQLAEDFDVLLNVADRFLQNKKGGAAYRDAPFPELAAPSFVPSPKIAGEGR